MIKTLSISACAVALGFVWSIAPALAQSTTSPTKEKERKADQIEKQTEQKADQIESEAKKKAKETRAKGDAEADRVRGKTGEGMMDRAKTKAGEMKDAAKESMKGSDGKASADVRAAQQALQAKGFEPGPIDGVMGPRTSAAVKEFQQKNNLPVTGSLDAETRDRLMAGGPSASPGTGRQSR